MGSNKELLLVHASMEHVSLSHSVNVMLTPQFYTLKKEPLPVKYLYQAKKIAPSLFDGLLEEGRSYEYLVFKEEGIWAFIAYDVDEITEFLSTKGIKAEQVSKLFFAQQSLSSFTDPVLLGKKEALVALDDAVVVVPQAALEEETKLLTFNDSFTPKTGVTLQGAYGSFLSMKQAMVLAIVFTIFAGMFFVEGWRYGNDSKAGEEEMQRLLEEYPSLQSKMQRKNIATKYKTIDTAERKKREVVKSLSRMIFKGVTLTSLALNEKSFKAQFSCSDAKVAKRLNELAKKEKLNTSKVSDGDDVQIEGTL
ncbi:MAG: hypothetical protein E3J96_05245 [Sulfurovum sp.]|nr:MAG: hypothetical protein E3J96_05245 [Sulfurovum sp.]